MVQKGKKPIIKPNIKNKLLQTLSQQGRFQLYGLRLGHNKVALVYLLYGHTGGAQNNEASSSFGIIFCWDLGLMTMKFAVKNSQV